MTHRAATSWGAVLACALLAGLIGGAPSVAQAPDPSASPGSPVAASVDPGASSAPVFGPSTFDPTVARALQRIVDGSQARIPAPGLSVAVRLADGRTWTGVAGDRELSPPRPVDPDTVFAIASITKTFVTAVVLQLVEDGRLSLDDRLSRFLPDFPRAGRITIRQLLGHTSGIHDYFTSAAYASQVFVDRSRRWTTDGILAMVGAPYCQPGACFHYSNTNFVLLGRVIEEVTGRPLSRVIRERLLDPLGLTRTVFQPDEPTPRDAAHGHLWAGGARFVDHTLRSRVLPHLSASSVAWAAGAMASTASDLARWAQALYAGDVLTETSRSQMLTFRARDEYGLGTRTRDFDGYQAIGHLGGIRGYELAMWYFPEQGASIVVLSNRGIYSTDRTVRMLARSLFTRLEATGELPAIPASPVPGASPGIASPVPVPSAAVASPSPAPA